MAAPSTPFSPTRDNLPSVVPVFAIPGAILLPGGRVPLIVFEPRYLAMIDDALGAGRLFGLVQPNQNTTVPADGLYAVGTLARIVAFGETGDGRYLITAQGMHRFAIRNEEEGRSGYRRVAVDYAPFAADLETRSVHLAERSRLISLVRAHLGTQETGSDWEALDNLSDDELTDRFAMACPFSVEDKQALLETTSHTERCHLMIALIQRDLMNEGNGSTVH